MKAWLSSLIATMQNLSAEEQSTNLVKEEEKNETINKEQNESKGTWLMRNEKNELVMENQRHLSIDEFHYYSPTNPGF